MRIPHLGCMVSLVAFSLSAATAAANCQLQQLATLPVDMQGLHPIVSTKINGTEARFMLDSGAFYSTIWRDAAVQYHLRVGSVLGRSYYVRGAGGVQQAWVTTPKSFEFLGVPLHNVQFLVVDQSVVSSTVGVIGQNVLRFSDVEYDLANGIVRFFKPMGCEHQPLAYWAVSTPYTAVNLQPVDAFDDHLGATAMINGKRMTVYFDTGAARSFLSLQAAERAGITPDSAGVKFLGMSGGFGPGSTKVWSAPVDTFQLGGEKVQHTHLLISNLDPAHRVGEVGDETPDMLLGEDFFLSHRIYVAYSQRKLYFTYNGGPLFNLDLPQQAAGAATPGAAPPASATTGEQPDSDAPTDADGFRRRAMAYASMQEFDRALADLTHACELDPHDAKARYERGLIYVRENQFKPALQDFSTAITLQPDDVEAHLARARLLQSHPDTEPADATAEVKSDLDTASRLAAPEAPERLVLSELYQSLGDYPAALDQIDQWLGHHTLRDEQAMGLNNRCWLRAIFNRDLQEALKDCNRALSLRMTAQKDPDALDSRGLVYLRLGSLKNAVEDYDSALQINPKIPSSLYGRGLAELRLGEKTQGDKDLGAAGKLDKDIAQRFAKMGLTP